MLSMAKVLYEWSRVLTQPLILVVARANLSLVVLPTCGCVALPSSAQDFFPPAFYLAL
jgi:hypothetical protein